MMIIIAGKLKNLKVGYFLLIFRWSQLEKWSQAIFDELRPPKVHLLWDKPYKWLNHDDDD